MYFSYYIMTFTLFLLQCFNTFEAYFLYFRYSNIPLKLNYSIMNKLIYLVNMCLKLSYNIDMILLNYFYFKLFY